MSLQKLGRQNCRTVGEDPLLCTLVGPGKTATALRLGKTAGNYIKALLDEQQVITQSRIVIFLSHIEKYMFDSAFYFRRAL